MPTKMASPNASERINVLRVHLTDPIPFPLTQDLAASCVTHRASIVFCGSPLAYARILFQHVLHPAILRASAEEVAPRRP